MLSENIVSAIKSQKDFAEGGYKITFGNTNCLVISCCGVIGDGIVRYPFEGSLQNFQHTKIFLCDPNDRWYYDGIPSFSTSLEETVLNVKLIVDMLNPKKIIAIGPSMGGYLSLILGYRLEFDTVITFSPQAFIDDISRRSIGDSRWSDTINQINLSPQYHNIINVPKEACFSLEKGKKLPSCYIYYPEIDEIDKEHANSLSKFNNVYISELPFRDHFSIPEMQNSGLLQAIFSLALS